jgi:DNA-binding NtrC family response regulator
MNTSYSGPTVLLGIPEIESSDVLTRHLSAAGCTINRAASISECLSQLQAREFELVVLDMSLNGSDGVDALSLCKNNERLLARSSLVFTSSDNSITAEQFDSVKLVGSREVVQMPPSADILEQLARLAHERRARGSTSSNGLITDRRDNDEFAILDDRNNQFEGAAHNERLTELQQTLVGDSPSMAAIRQLIMEVAPTRASVMIYGESGTGKELVAQAIHRYSKQSNGPFVPVNMAAIPHGLAESLLFGHEKGAFTSAVHNQKGWCEAADGGTLFLDEVSDMEIQVQPKLLRFLQEGTLQRVGSQACHRVSLRVITATNQDPGEVVAQGRMREDLFFRLHVVPIYVPPLRDRPEDIPKLAMMFLRRAAERHDRLVEGFSDDALRVLQQHDWPGNVRQLENTVERLVIFARGRVVEADHIPADDHLASAYAERRRVLSGTATDRSEGNDFDPIVSLTPIERHERGAIVDALRRVDGHVIDAARLLGLGQATVYRKIKQYAIPHMRKRRRNAPR